MQREHQEKTHCPQTSTNETGFQLLQPSLISTNLRLLNPSQLPRNMEGEKSSSRVTQQAQQQQQDSSLGTERLSILHSKLHQEADKIRKWKVKTEIDMKHKDKKLNEAKTTIESLRKSMLELQLENENLSKKLQEELSNREDVMQKIKDTRDLIDILKEQEEELEAKLTICETERTELKYLEKEHAQQFEEMIEKFRRLEIEAKRDADDLIKKVEQEQEQKKSLEKELQKKIAESNYKVQLLSGQIDEKDIALREVHVRLLKQEDRLLTTFRELGGAQQEVSSLSAKLATTKEELDKLMSERAVLHNEKEQLVTQLMEERERVENARRQEDSVQEALNNSVAIFNQRQGNLQRDIELLRVELSDEQKRLKEARAQLTESLTFSECLKSSRDVLLLEKTEMELCLEKLKLEVTELQTEKYRNKAEISSLEAEVESMQTHLQLEQQAASRLQVLVDDIKSRCTNQEERKQLQQELHNMKQTINMQKDELQKNLQTHSEDSKQTLQLQDTIAQLQTELSDARTKMEQLQADLLNCQAKLSAKDSEITSATAQMEKTAAEFKILIEENTRSKTQICDLTDQLNAFRKEKDATEARLAALGKEKYQLQQDQEAKGEVAEKERQTSLEKQGHLEQQLKDNSADLEANIKIIKDLEKELKSVKSKLKTQERKQEEKSREVDYLRQELSAGESTKDQREKLISSLQSYLELETKKAQQNAQQVEKLQKAIVQEQKEKNEALVHCENRIIEMTATLEKNTADHQKFLAIKDKELAELGGRNAQLTTMSKESEKSVKQLTEDHHILQQQMTNLKTVMEKLEKNKAAEIESLQVQLQEQTNLVKEMKENQPVVQPSAQSSHNVEVEESLPVPTSSVPRKSMAEMQNLPVQTKQRSILRQTGSVRRRKVAFISASVDNAERSDSDSYRELEVEDQGSHKPLRLRTSPHKKRSLVSVPVVLTPKKCGFILEGVNKDTKLKQHISTTQSNLQEPVVLVKDKEFCKTPNMWKSPLRTTRFFHSSPRERNLQKKQEVTQEQISWFDFDTVYAFGSDD